MQVVTGSEYTPVIWDLATGKELVTGKPFAAPFGSSSPNKPRLTVTHTGAVLVASFVPDDASVRTQQQKGHWQLEALGSGRPPFKFPPQAGRVFEFVPGTKSGVFIAQGGPYGADAELWDLERHQLLWTIAGADRPRPVGRRGRVTRRMAPSHE